MAIVYREGHEVDLDQLATLFNSAGWQAGTLERTRLQPTIGRCDVRCVRVGSRYFGWLCARDFGWGDQRLH